MENSHQAKFTNFLIYPNSDYYHYDNDNVDENQR